VLLVIQLNLQLQTLLVSFVKASVAMAISVKMEQEPFYHLAIKVVEWAREYTGANVQVMEMSLTSHVASRGINAEVTLYSVRAFQDV